MLGFLQGCGGGFEITGVRGLVFHLCERLVSVGVDATLPELLLDAGVPEVLDLVVGPSWQT